MYIFFYKKESNEIAEQLLLIEQKKQKERQVADQKSQVKIWVQTNVRKI